MKFASSIQRKSKSIANRSSAEGRKGVSVKQDETVIQTLEKLGGIATLGRLYQEILKKRDWKTKTPQASIRRIVQNSQDIYKIKPGLWALKSRQKELEDRGIIVETEKNKDSRIVQEFTHSYYQGLLVTIGNLRNLKTFVPNQDKSKMFLDEKLGDLRTLQEQPLYSYEKFTKRSSTIDVIWFNDREMPGYFFEVEHSTDFQNSLNKFSDLQDFFVKCILSRTKSDTRSMTGNCIALSMTIFGKE